jgi:uncharacterized membrane protein (DUF373 family)
MFDAATRSLHGTPAVAGSVAARSRLRRIQPNPFDQVDKAGSDAGSYPCLNFGATHPPAGLLFVFQTMAVEQRNRALVARVFTAVEDVVYVGLGLLLAGCSLALLISGIISFGQNLMAGSLTINIVAMLDRVLLILLVVELLYTVQVSFREHALVPEPFLLIGLIAGIRRVLLLTAELAHVQEKSDVVFQHFIVELVALTVLIVALVISLVLLRKKNGVVAERAK